VHATDLMAMRQTLGLSRARLAEYLHVHYQTVAKWERGERRIPAMAVQLLDLLRQQAAAHLDRQAPFAQE
jgi:DNA-binding transcriptional regulator YiaG